jgi:DNA-binding GntR family transcriptional regulator
VIADELRRRVNDGFYAAGQLLPSESDVGHEPPESLSSIDQSLVAQHL